MDLIEEIAYPFPATVLAELVGLPVADRAQFKRWSVDIVALHSTGRPQRRGRRACVDRLQAARDWLRELMAERRTRPTDDVLSVLVTAEIDGDSLTEL